MAETIRTDLCIIGAGSAGLSLAAGASQLGADVTLIERGRMGGDCLNYGCVPSKSLIAAAHAAQAVRDAGRFGVRAATPEIDFQAVHDHVHGVIAAIAPHDSEDRFTGLGVRVIRAEARFTGPRAVVAGDAEIVARRFVIATGSAPAVPPIPGLADTPFFTNETIFDIAAPIEHLVIIGGGPIGMELAQAHRRLGARVTVLEALTVLGNDDPELAEVVKRRFEAEDITVHEGATVSHVSRARGEVLIEAQKEGAALGVEGSHLLLAVGRMPNLKGLNLEAAGVDYSRTGVVVDAGLRTTNRRIYAIGDAAEGFKFTHIAGYHAGVVVRSALFRLPAKVDYRAIPWTTFTAPELAQVGLTEAQARARHGEIRILRFPFAENDRAQAERETEGMLKVITTRRGVVVGAGMVGDKAGELIQGWCLPIARGMKVSAVANLILPYPTLGEINKRAAGTYYLPALFSERTRRIVRLLLKLG